MAQLHGKQIKSGSIPNSALATPAGQSSSLNKAMIASVTTANGQVACATAIAAKPAGYPMVQVNGAEQTLGDGVKTTDCYFSADGGTTARTIALIAIGDLLYWNGAIAGFQLDTTDRISFIYAA